jgi:hypothetical protein
MVDYYRTTGNYNIPGLAADIENAKEKIHQVKMSTFVKVSKKTVSEAPLKEAIILDRLVGTIINNINPAKNQLDKHRELQESEQNN